MKSGLKGIKMKRSCKFIDITNPETIEPWVTECLFRHKQRYDFQRLIANAGNIPRKHVTEQNNNFLKDVAHTLAISAASQIKERKLDILPVTYKTRVDPSTAKIRQIGNECAMQQILDYIAVRSCEEIWRRRIVPQQVAGIRGRGTLYGVNMIQKWVRKDNVAMKLSAKHHAPYTSTCKFHVKLDVTQCYPSMRVDTFMSLFRRDCGNKDILWLWETLLNSHKQNGYEGFMIGAWCSQWACQYVLSFLYRHLTGLHNERRGKRVKLVQHIVFQMDDLLLVGSNRKNLKSAVRSVIAFAKTLGLTIKGKWHIVRLQDTPIDIIGYRIHRNGKRTIRPRIFIRARRTALRFERKPWNVQLARRMCSYKGYFVHSNVKNMEKLWKIAQNVVSKDAKRRNKANGTCILQQTA